MTKRWSRLLLVALWMALKTEAVSECPDGQYGQNCEKLCVNRKCQDSSGSSCDHLTGECVSGCKRGFYSVDCVERCDTDHYGTNCESLCADRHCKGEQLCHYALGYCDDGCLPGWTGFTCTDTATSTQDHRDDIIIALAVAAGVLLLFLVIAMCTLCWYIRRLPRKWKSNEHLEMNRTISQLNQATDTASLEYDTADGQYNKARSVGQSRDKTLEQPNRFSSGSGYANVVLETNQYESLDSFSSPKNDYANIT
ncbi:multiple epidermal growth factor-like domains protein 11 [Gigantopelta aegis]|uniref:multiple epidermal growth factor-like domains protein 11 n=1 Tax=Gigantopelta aegis TaxID=1735272 RepID=UPI001B88DE5A|nr:multiple epidermal growth factor-like domains protein 11 [Gigantopelta aegis]